MSESKGENQPTDTLAPKTQVASDENDAASAYALRQQALRTLTLPELTEQGTVRGWDIPDSPKEDPDPTLQDKVDKFLSLKHDDVHFNVRLANTAAFRNPQVLQSLIDHFKIDQYASMLPSDVYDPSSFPPDAFAESIDRAQEERDREREQRQQSRERTNVEFSRESSSGPNRGAGRIDSEHPSDKYHPYRQSNSRGRDSRRGRDHNYHR